MSEFVRLDVDAGVGTIRWDRPPVNALNDQVQRELALAAGEANEREDVRAVILYGGEKTFAGGADIKEMSQKSYAEIATFAANLSASLTVLATISKPTVAAITGYALGGGMELALTADYRIGADDCAVGQPEIRLGVIPGAGGTQRLTRLIGPSKAKDLIFSGRVVKADEAHRLGILDRLVPADEVYSAAHAWANQFTTGPAVALKAAKVAIDGGLDVDLASGLRLETQLFASLWATEDQAEGMRSFIENGPGKAQFRGK